MKATGAVEIFIRSISSTKLRNTTFIGDGDSSSSAWVKESLEEKFDFDCEICEGECLGHVQKGLGTVDSGTSNGHPSASRRQLLTNKLCVG